MQESDRERERDREREGVDRIGRSDKNK